MRRKRYRDPRREAVEAILKTLPWQDRKKIEEAGLKYITQKDLDAVERLYYRAIGLSNEEIERRMNMRHNLKTIEPFFSRLGFKKVEIRKNDRDYNNGDILDLGEFQPDHNLFTGKGKSAVVTDVLPLSEVPGLTEWVVPPEQRADNPLKDYVAMSLCFLDPISQLAQVMEEEIKAHAHKGPVEKMGLTQAQLLDNLRLQVHEFEQALLDFQNGKIPPVAVLKKAAGVGNYTAFLIDQAGVLLK